MPIYVGTGGADTLAGSAGDDTILGNAGNDTLDGLAGNDSIEGGDGNDDLFGGVGDDTLNGGAGNDRLIIDSSTDRLQEAPEAGSLDIAITSASFRLAAGVEVERLIAGTFTTAGVFDNSQTTAINLAGNEFAQQVLGNAGSNVLDGGRNSNPALGDSLQGLAGDDTYIIRNSNDVISAAFGSETAANGNDTVYVSIADLEAAGQAVATFNLGTLSNGQFIETLSAQDQSGTQNLSLTGNDQNQNVVGNQGNNTLAGGGGTDVLIGLGGNDTYVLTSTTETIQETTGSDTIVFAAGNTFAGTFTLAADVSVENITLGNGVTNVTGNNLAQTITGTAAVETLAGGGGADTLIGGAGADTYIVSTSAVAITELATDADTDTVYYSGTTGGYDLAAGVAVENLVAGAGANFAAAIATTTNTYVVGNERSQVLYGNAGNNILDGDRGTGTNVDTLAGGAGDDIYRVYAQSDVVDERIYTALGTPTAGSDAGGNDTVFTSATYSLAAATVFGNVENLSVADQGGTTAGITLTGNALANRIAGNNAANTIIGGAGADTLIGLGGSDIYTVDDAGDVVTEFGGGGTQDTINFATVAGFTAYTLAAGSEVDLINLGGNVVNVTGNELAQTIIGTGVAETLTGGGGADVLSGGGGIDVYNVADSAAVIVDNDGLANVVNFTGTTGGIDITDGQSIASITATGTFAVGAAGVFLVGNNAVQTITGGNGNDILNGQGGVGGGGGGDTLVGGAGDDIYRVYTSNLVGNAINNAVGDLITEGANAGNDIVYTSANYVLGANVEQLVAADQANVTTLTLVGNGLNNVISGSNGNNVLVGAGGNDTLTGLGGADTFHFNQAVGAADADIIADFNGAQGDRISLDANIFSALGNTLDASEFQLGTIATATSTGQGPGVILYDQATGRLFYDADGAGAGAALLFATLSPGTALTAANFTITPANTLPTP